MNYDEALKYLQSLEVFGVRLGLQRIEELLRRLDNPEKKYKTIHITGTNGKGSAAHFVANALTACGIKTALYTSPHLSRYEERITIDGKLISKEEFAETISKVKSVIEEMLKSGTECPTQFEVLTAVAFLYFAEQKVEYAVIEVGLGGLLDSTNVIIPEISVITNVTLEHADKCGGTLQGVAEHKAGIIKENIPVVTGAKGEPLNIIKRVAKEKNSDIFVLDEDFFVKRKGESLNFKNADEEIDYTLAMKALYQAENSAVAWEALFVLAKKDYRIKKDVAVKAIENTVHAGRFEQIGNIILDGAHNPAGIAALRETLDALYSAEKRIFLLGMLKDKAVEEMLSILIREDDEVIVTKPVSNRAMSEDELFALAKKYTDNVVIAKSIEDGINILRKSDGIRIIAGSLYLIGAARERLIDNENMKR
ncbi:MAG: bifunctional folylpolyglutamate synthase/dihydrofolate synthase [Selenomonadaceae bacterium]|nr:bifunctional folylpolyglutamate synthase/dihydrofolate synthase [Selenomonadaceae bacterium]